MQTRRPFIRRCLSLSALLLLLSVPQSSVAQLSLLKKVGTLLDSMAIRGMDRRYVELPAKPWQVIGSNLRDEMEKIRMNPGALWEEPAEYRIWEIGQASENSRLRANIDARLSVSYNLGDWFFCAYGQLHHFSYSQDVSTGSLFDWYVNTSIGLRL